MSIERRGYGFFLEAGEADLPDDLAGASGWGAGVLATGAAVTAAGGLSGDFFTSNTFTRTAASLVKGELG